MQRLVRDLNAVYRSEPALWDADYEPEGFTWLVSDDADHNVFAFARFSTRRRAHRRVRREPVAGAAARVPPRASRAAAGGARR